MVKKILCYTGIGARKNRRHTIKNVTRIAKKIFTKSRCKSMKARKKNLGFGSECPKNTNDKGWLNFVGAEYTTRKECI